MERRRLRIAAALLAGLCSLILVMALPSLAAPPGPQALSLDILAHDQVGQAGRHPLESEAAGVQLEPDCTRQAHVGESILHEHTLTNTGSETDTFVLEFASTQGWPTELLAACHPSGALTLSLQIGPQMTKSLEVSLTVPLQAAVAEVTIITAPS